MRALNFPAFTSRWRLFFLIVTGAAALRVVHLLILRALYELQGGFAGEGHIYMAVGRGILNGLLPYLDLFETKPPGMFLISAVSLYFFDDITLGLILQCIITLGLALMTMWGAWMIVRPQWKNRDHTLIIFTIIGISALISYYTSVRGGGFQTESFGSFFSGLYLLGLVAARNKKGWLIPALSGLAIMGSIGLKEPFVLAAMGGAILLVPTLRDAVRLFVFPLLVAAVSWAVVLLLLGYWTVYTEIYLHFIFSDHLSLFGPTWTRAFYLEKLWLNLSDFAWPLGTLFVLLFLSSWWMSMKNGRTAKEKMAFGFSVLAATISVITARLAAVYLFSGGQPSSVVFPIVLFFFAAGFLSIYLSYRQYLGKRTRDALMVTIRYLVFLYLLIQTVGMGGEFAGRHFGFAAPFFITLFFAAIEQFGKKIDSAALRRWSLMAVCLILVAVTLPQRQDFVELKQFLKEEEKLKKAAADLDAMLDSCGVDRYLIVGEGVPLDVWAFTHHSPLGPGFFQFSLNYPIYWRTPSDFFIASHIRNIKSATVLLMADKDSRPIPKEVTEYVYENFTITPPLCANNLQLPDQTVVLYRMPQ